MPRMGPRTLAVALTGEQIKAFRAERGLKQADLAVKLGVSKHALSFMETGRTQIDRRTELAILAVAAGLDSGAVI